MKINNIAFIGIPVTDVRRARKFYEEALGFAVSDEMMAGKWIEYAVGDSTLGIKVSRSPLSLLKRRVVTWQWCKIPTETNL